MRCCGADGNRRHALLSPRSSAYRVAMRATVAGRRRQLTPYALPKVQRDVAFMMSTLIFVHYAAIVPPPAAPRRPHILRYVDYAVIRCYISAARRAARRASAMMPPASGRNQLLMVRSKRCAQRQRPQRRTLLCPEFITTMSSDVDERMTMPYVRHVMAHTTAQTEHEGVNPRTRTHTAPA